MAHVPPGTSRTPASGIGAHLGGRIRETLRCALGTVAFFALLWTGLSFAVPFFFIQIFMEPTAEILAIAPGIIRTYGLSFLLLPLNIFSTYYFQAIMKPSAAFVVSVSRGFVISGILILLLPAVFSPDSLWFAMPVTELLTAVYVLVTMYKDTRALPDTGNAQ